MMQTILQPRFLRLLALLLLLLASASVAQAQRAEISITDGGVISTSAVGQNASFDGVAFDHQFTVKAGLVFPGRIGVGLFFEQAHFSKKQTLPEEIPKRSPALLPLPNPNAQ